MRQIVIILLFLLGTAAVSAKDVYVSNDGSDDNVGTHEEPFASLQRALATFEAGVLTVKLPKAPEAKGRRIEISK